MNTLKFGLVMAAGGLVTGIALVLSCGGNTPESDASEVADAAAPSCDCPIPVSFHSRLREVRVTETLSNNDEFKDVWANCDSIGLAGRPSPTAIAGHCTGLIAPRNLPLVQAGTFVATGSHHCVWNNPDRLNNIQLTATVICLLPEDYPPDYLLDAGVR